MIKNFLVNLYVLLFPWTLYVSLLFSFSSGPHPRIRACLSVVCRHGHDFLCNNNNNKKNVTNGGETRSESRKRGSVMAPVRSSCVLRVLCGFNKASCCTLHHSRWRRSSQRTTACTCSEFHFSARMLLYSQTTPTHTHPLVTAAQMWSNVAAISETAFPVRQNHTLSDYFFFLNSKDLLAFIWNILSDRWLYLQSTYRHVKRYYALKWTVEDFRTVMSRYSSDRLPEGSTAFWDIVVCFCSLCFCVKRRFFLLNLL